VKEASEGRKKRGAPSGDEGDGRRDRGENEIVSVDVRAGREVTCKSTGNGMQIDG
jgi:hypothetical protein